MLTDSISKELFDEVQDLFHVCLTGTVDEVSRNDGWEGGLCGFVDDRRKNGRFYFDNKLPPYKKTSCRGKLPRKEKNHFFSMPLSDGDYSERSPFPEVGELLAFRPVERFQHVPHDNPNHCPPCAWWGRVSPQFFKLQDFFLDHDHMSWKKDFLEVLEETATERGIYTAFLYMVLRNDLSPFVDVSRNEDVSEWKGFTSFGLIWSMAEKCNYPEWCVEFKKLGGKRRMRVD